MNDKTRVVRGLIFEGSKPIEVAVSPPSLLRQPPLHLVPTYQGQLYRRGVAALYAREKAVADFRRVSRRLLGA